MPQFLFLMKLTTTSDKTDSHKIITLQKSKHGKGNHVTLGYFSWIKLWGRKVLQSQFRIFYPCQFMTNFTYNNWCTSNLPKSKEELESISEIVQNDISTSKNSIALILRRAG